MDSMANTFSVCQVMVSLRVKKHLSASALVMGVVMGILNRESFWKDTLEIISHEELQQVLNSCHAALGWPLVCSSVYHQETHSDFTQNWNPAARWPSQDGLWRISTPGCSQMWYPALQREKRSLEQLVEQRMPNELSLSWATHLISSMKLWTTCGAF